MSDLKLFSLTNKKEIKKNRLGKHEIRELIEENIEDLLGITLIFKDYPLYSNEELVEVVGYDENYQLVVIEYRIGRFSSTINKGLIYLDYIKNNQGKVKSIISQELGYDITNNFNLNPRLIVIGNDFNKYDEYAIKQMPFVIELIKYQVFENKFILLEKNYQSTNSYLGINHYKFKNLEEHNLYKSIRELMLALGDEVLEVNTNNYIAYRKIKNFAYLTFENGIELKVKKNKFKTIKIKNLKDLEKAQIALEVCYDEN